MNRSDIRLALPSKGRLAAQALDLLSKAGLSVHHPNPRQYFAEIPSMPDLTVVFQRPGDIVVGVREGSVDFGITGWDIVSEYLSTSCSLPQILCSCCFAGSHKSYFNINRTLRKKQGEKQAQ